MTLLVAGTASVAIAPDDRLESGEYSNLGHMMSTSSIDASLVDRPDNTVCLVDSDMVVLRDTDKIYCRLA